MEEDWTLTHRVNSRKNGLHSAWDFRHETFDFQKKHAITRTKKRIAWTYFKSFPTINILQDLNFKYRGRKRK